MSPSHLAAKEWSSSKHLRLAPINTTAFPILRRAREYTPGWSGCYKCNDGNACRELLQLAAIGQCAQRGLILTGRSILVTLAKEAGVRMTESRRALVIQGATMTPLYLIGSFFVGALLGDLVFFGLPGHLQDAAKVPLAALPTLLCVFAGGALWGRGMARLARRSDVKRSMWAGALGYGPTVVLVGLALTVLENLFVEQRRGPDLPIHDVFTLLFVPAVFVVATVGALALGIGLQRGGLSVRLALGSGLAAGITFFLIDRLLDMLGWRVGAPGAAERATMVTVLLTGSAAASLAAGAVIGLLLSGGPER